MKQPIGLSPFFKPEWYTEFDTIRRKYYSSYLGFREDAFWQEITNEKIAEWKIQDDEYKTEWNRQANELRAKFNAAKTEFLIYLNDKNGKKYVNNLYSDVRSYPVNFDAIVIDAKKKYLETKQNKEKEELKKQEDIKYQTDAINYLLAKGKKLGEDFNSGNAVAIANELASILAIEEFSKNEGPYEFNGDSNCESCGGYIPGNHRCECGNRRVSMLYEGDFKSGHVYCEAY